MYYIIEHPTRGTLKDLEWTNAGKRGRFSREGMRNDPETTMRFNTVESAQEALSKVDRSDGCQIRASEGKTPGMADWAGSWPVVWP